MTDLENSLRIVDLSSLTVNRVAVTSGTGTGAAANRAAPAPIYSYTIALRTYWLK